MGVQNTFLITFSLALAELRTFMATSISIKMKVKIARWKLSRENPPRQESFFIIKEKYFPFVSSAPALVVPVYTILLYSNWILS